MRAALRALALLGVLAMAMAPAAGCGTGGDYSGGAFNLPDWGGGAFLPLAPEAAQAFTAPYVLTDPAGDLADPALLTDGARLSMWVTVKRGAEAEIERADARSLDAGFGALAPALAADAAWEGGAVRGPSVVPGAPWLMLYAAGGAIGWAISPDGAAWTKAPGPALRADGAGEGTALGAPAVVVLGGAVRVYYPAAGAIWAAEAPLADLAAARATTWTRLDGDPSTPVRDPMVAGVPFGGALDRPSARVEPTASGELRHTLAFTVTLADGTSACGFAASFTGVGFAVQPTALLPLAIDARAPVLVDYRGRPLLFYVGRFGARDAIGAAGRP